MSSIVSSQDALIKCHYMLLNVLHIGHLFVPRIVLQDSSCMVVIVTECLYSMVECCKCDWG
jgi:hypothetical protein